MPKIANEKLLRELNEFKKKEKRMRSSEMRDLREDESCEEEDMSDDNPIIFAKRKLKNIDDYINGT